MKNKITVILLFIMICSISGVGIAYASWTNKTSIMTNVGTGTMDFMFDDSSMNPNLNMKTNEYYKVYMGKGTDEFWEESKQELQAEISFDGKALKIEKMQQISLSDFEDGDLSFKIYYIIKPTNDENGILQIAEIGESDGGYDCNDVSFVLNIDNSLCNLEWTIGGKTESTTLNPQEVLPNSINMHAYNTILKSDTDGIMEGVVTLKQTEPLVWDLGSKIDTKQYSSIEEDSIKSDKSKKKQIQVSLNLEVSAEYDFTIPLVFDQFNVGNSNEYSNSENKLGEGVIK